MSLQKELQELIRQATLQGWVVSKTKNNHYKWVSPFGGMFFSASTPSDLRGYKNLKRDLKVNGFITITKQHRRKR